MSQLAPSPPSRLRPASGGGPVTNASPCRSRPLSPSPGPRPPIAPVRRKREVWASTQGWYRSSEWEQGTDSWAQAALPSCVSDTPTRPSLRSPTHGFHPSVPAGQQGEVGKRHRRPAGGSSWVSRRRGKNALTTRGLAIGGSAPTASASSGLMRLRSSSSGDHASRRRAGDSARERAKRELRRESTRPCAGDRVRAGAQAVPAQYRAAEGGGEYAPSVARRDHDHTRVVPPGLDVDLAKGTP